ncbi:MAG: chromate transporter, partial [Betaproteobacteria bacterium]|nr:chromate transporter [Betaproteobacteria bacterium]
DLTPSWLGALMALTSIFLPGFLLVIGVMPLWSRLIGYPLATSMLAGVNAAVVGFLLASLYDPIFVHAVRKPLHFALALLAYALLVLPRLSPLWIVLLGVLAGLLLDL